MVRLVLKLEMLHENDFEGSEKLNYFDVEFDLIWAKYILSSRKFLSVFVLRWHLSITDFRLKTTLYFAVNFFCSLTITQNSIHRQQ